MPLPVRLPDFKARSSAVDTAFKSHAGAGDHRLSMSAEHKSRTARRRVQSRDRQCPTGLDLAGNVGVVERAPLL